MKVSLALLRRSAVDESGIWCVDESTNEVKHKLWHVGVSVARCRNTQSLFLR